MELWVLYTRWENWQDVEEDRLLSALPLQRLARLSGAPADKRRQVLAAYGLLRYGLRTGFGVETMPALAYGVYGKPYFAEDTECCFNLSHTEGLALCALCGAPVGADAEKLRPVTAERAARLRLPAAPEAFYAGWVERESRVKLHGGSALQCRAPVAAETGECYHPLNVGPGYAAGVCAACDAPVRIEQLALAELFRGCTAL